MAIFNSYVCLPEGTSNIVQNSATMQHSPLEVWSFPTWTCTIEYSHEPAQVQISYIGCIIHCIATIYIYMWRGPLCIEWRGLENCPKVNFDFICRRSTFSHFHLASEDLNYNSIREASLKSDLHIHLLFNVSINSWLHFLWLSFKFAVLFILAFVDFLSEI